MHKTIESLLQQSLLPEKIILWLSNEEFPNKIQNLPDSLKRLICNKFSIQFCKDIHSYKKLIPTLRLYPDSAIVTVDDDVVYGKNLVSSLVESYKKSPHMIHCCRCHLLQVDGMGNLLPYKRWIWSDSLLEISPSYRNFFTGVGGVLYPPHSLYRDVFDEDKFKRLCPSGDDIWFWAMAVLNGTLIKRIESYREISSEYIKESQKESLWKSNKIKNDLMINNIFEYYPELSRKICEIQPVYKLSLLTHLKQRVKSLTY